MINKLSHRTALWLASLATLLASTSPALAQNHSWTWPLYVRHDAGPGLTPITGEPRPALWNSAGEYQHFTDFPYMHPGHDVRGNYGDIVVNPTAGSLQRIYNYADDCLMTGSACRLWLATADGKYLYYVSHVDFAEKPATDATQPVTEIREIFEAVHDGSATAEQRKIAQNTVLSSLTNFRSANWHHVHLGIFDTTKSYQMVNTVQFLQQVATGKTGESLTIVDDEPPVINEVRLVTDQTDTPATVAGVCGPEVSGKVDVLGDMYDTFFTNGAFADFPGKTTLNPNTGLRWASYSVLRVADNQQVSGGVWYDIDGLPLLCRPGTETQACVLASDPNPSLANFFLRMEKEDGGPSVGLTVIDKLFNQNLSKSDYTTPGGEQYFHNLTNSQGLEGAWDTSLTPNGRYQVTVQAEDFAFIRSSKTIFVNVHAPGTTLDSSSPGLGDVYVRDRLSDVGATPSNPAGEPFWESPDIFVVPEGTMVSVDSLAVQSAVTAGGKFDVYVRVKNDGCREVSGVQAKVRSANPAALNSDWLAVGSADYQGDVTVPAGGSALVGPFHWQPTAAEATGDGHRCLLADITAPGDTLPVTAEFNAPGFNNVAQRNMRVSGCGFQLPNVSLQNGTVSLRITTDAAIEDASTSIELVGPLVQSWYTAWANVTGTSISTDGVKMRLRIRLRDITLPAVPMLAGAAYDFSFDISLPEGEPSHRVGLQATLGSTTSGFSCFAAGQPIVK